MSDSDQDLLQRFVRNRDQDAFTELVKRHINLVYSAALRQVRSHPLAEEIAQSVFVDLARDAARLKADTVLTAWLFAITRGKAIDVVRKESRRMLREQIAVEMNAMNATESNWSHVEPLLDEAVAALEDADRTAILLRYFENKSLREVGQRLGVGDDAAQKRVSRAVERLREFFSKRNVTIGASGLVVLISANAVQAAPAALIATISGAALSGTAISTYTVAAATKTIVMTTFQKAVVTATIAVIAGAGIYQARQAAKLREQVTTLQQQQQPLMDQINRLKQDRDEASLQIAALRDDNDRLNRDNVDLLKLRAEVVRLKTLSGTVTKAQSDATPGGQETDDDGWVRRIKLLKQRINDLPGDRIPELRYMTESDWMEAARGQLATEDDFQKAFADVRSRAQSQFMNKMGDALQKYLAANNNVFPADVSQLKEFFRDPIEDGLLERYQVRPGSSEPLAGISQTNSWVIVPMVQESGSFIALGPNGGTSHSVDSPDMRVLAPALKAMLDAAPVINGRRNGDIHQLEPYLTTPEQHAAYQHLLQQSNRGTN